MSRVNPCYWLYHYFRSECNKRTIVPHQLLLSIIIRCVNTTQYVTMPLHCYGPPIKACNNGLLCHICIHLPLIYCPSGVISEYFNPYIPTHTPEEYWSDHMQTPGWQPILCVAWCLIWHLQVEKKVWSYMTLNVLTETRCHYTTQTKPNQTSSTVCKPRCRSISQEM